MVGDYNSNSNNYINFNIMSCKYDMNDCIFRNTNKCKVCKNMSQYEWDYTLIKTEEDDSISNSSKRQK